MAINFAFRKFSSLIMGLCLIYHVNLELFTQATIKALWKIHQVNISYLVSKYFKIADTLYKIIIDNFDYKSTDYLAADKTYVKIKSVSHYTRVIMNAIKKFILGYKVSNSKDSCSCILFIYVYALLLII